MQTIILRDSGTPPITTIAGLTVTTSSRLAPGFLGTQWPPFTGGSMDIAEPIDVSVASRIVSYSYLAAFWLTYFSLLPPQGVKWYPSGNYHSWLDAYYELSSDDYNGRHIPRTAIILDYWPAAR